MNTDLQPHQARIQKVGKVLWGFSWFWLIFNLLALVVVIALVLVLGVAGKMGKGDMMIEAFSQGDLIPGVEAELIRAIAEWDYAGFLDHFGLNIFYVTFGAGLFLVTMILILRIAGAWKRGDVFGDKPVRCFRILGWIYLVHGIIGQLWGMAGQFVGASNTCDLIYFSFIRDICLMTFAMSGTGIEWGFLCLALSWILEHARLLREEQEFTI